MTLHKPVLLKETIENLNLKKGDIVVDATLGGGGHAEAVLKKIGKAGKLIAFDLDEEAIGRFESKVEDLKFKINENIFLVNRNFSCLEETLKDLKIEKVNAVVADLGWSSDQVSDPKRGMSFTGVAPLDMRYDQEQKNNAKKIINEYSQEDLERIIREYGEEKFYRNIARKIIERRKKKIIETTTELAEIIKNAVPKKYRYGKINPATRTFQALRIEVNQELENLKKFIPQAIEALLLKGRLGIISFHSLEDRIVKKIFRENAGGCIYSPASSSETLRTGPSADEFIYGRRASQPKIRAITKKPILPSEKEIAANPRSRSAKLRVAEKV